MHVEDLTAGASKVVFDTYGVPAAITTQTGAYETRGIVRHDVQITDDYGSVAEVQHLVTLERVALPVWPRRGDTVEIAGATYQVVQVLGYDDHEIRVAAA